MLSDILLVRKIKYPAVKLMINVCNSGNTVLKYILKFTVSVDFPIIWESRQGKGPTRSYSFASITWFLVHPIRHLWCPLQLFLLLYTIDFVHYTRALPSNWSTWLKQERHVTKPLVLKESNVHIKLVHSLKIVSHK